jgi:hypothetical protein
MANFYPFAGSFNVPELSSLDWPRLEGVCRLTFTAEQRDAMLAELNSYISDAVWQHFSPPMKAVQRRLGRIESLTRKLVALISTPPSTERSPQGGYIPPEERDFALYQAVLFELGVCDPTDPARRQEILWELIFGAKAGRERLRTQSRRGRHPRVGLRRMIRRWHAVYKMAGGVEVGCFWSASTSQYEGPFLDLVDGTFDQVVTDHRAEFPKNFTLESLRPSRDGLAQMIVEQIRPTHASRPSEKK